MREIAAIVEAYERAHAAGHRCALVTVVHVDGSFYRRPGARMLVTDEGACTGAISGGCLEGDALRKALLAISSGTPKLVTYDTSDEEDVSIGVQLGCSGIIQVLFEPIDESKEWNPIRILEEVVRRKSTAALVTLFNIKDPRGPQIGAVGCLIEDRRSKIEDPLGATLIRDPRLLDMAKGALLAGKSTFTELGSYESVAVDPGSSILDPRSQVCFIQVIPAPLRLVIAGAGNDAVPLAKIGDVLGWEVSIIDGRSSHARADRFVPGCQVIVSKPEEALAKLEIDERTVFVLMTHNYHYDLAMLKAILGTPASYIGLLGPAKKRERMFSDLMAQGLDLSEEDRLRIYGPSGLEMGAETPEEIALSIAAEIQAVMGGHSGGYLRDKPDTIHDRGETLIRTGIKTMQGS